MPLPVTVKCPACGHSWSVDLDRYTPVREIYRGDEGARVKVEEYRFKCPVDGEYFIQTIEFDELAEEAS